MPIPNRPQVDLEKMVEISKLRDSSGERVRKLRRDEHGAKGGGRGAGDIEKGATGEDKPEKKDGMLDTVLKVLDLR